MIKQGSGGILFCISLRCITNSNCSYSALTQAALQGEPAILEVMLKANVDPNAKDRHDRTPLYVGRYCIERLAIRNRPDLMLAVAALCDRGNIAKVLTKCEDINVDMVCTDGQTATEAATISGSKDVLKVSALVAPAVLPCSDQVISSLVLLLRLLEMLWERSW